MKIQLFLVFLLLVLFQSCTDSVDKDRIIGANLDIIIQDNISWRDDLRNYNNKIDEDQTELRRRFFSNYSTSHDVYLHLSTIVQYFDFEDQILIDYSLLLEQREELIAPLYRCDNISMSKIRALIKVENEIIEKLKSIK